MSGTIINIGLAFLEGFALIISPCILPILPIILTGSLTGSKSRPLGIIIGFILTFTLFTLSTRSFVELTHINPEILHYISYGLLLLFGVIMLSSTLTEKFTGLTQRLTQVGSSLTIANNTEGGIWGGIVFGGLVGIVWTPCAGPLLAAVIVQSSVQHTTIAGLLVVLAFGIGAGVPMLLIALMGRSIMDKLKFFRQHTGLFRKILGLIIILSVFGLMYESNLTFAMVDSTNDKPATSLINGIDPYPAAEIAGIDAWINSPPLTLSALRGKVVLIDFWTYSCINCIRTLPYLIDWYAKYHNKGFEIIGIHSPEFAFERDAANVKNAVAKSGIHYPVALDNHFVTWQNFHNQYWPAHYLINQKGEVVYEHFGEGQYDVTENNIRFLLGINGLEKPARAEQYYSYRQTPETYLGYARADNMVNTESVTHDVAADYTYPTKLATDQWALQGKWIVSKDKIVAGAAGAAIKLHFTAGIVYAVIGTNKPMTVAVKIQSGIPALIDGREGPIGKISIKRSQLYTVVDLKQEGEGELELIAPEAGLEIYTFTFGS